MLNPLKKNLYTEKNKKLCRFLVDARKKAGLTQSELAEKIGKNQSFVAKYEGGERRLDLIELLEIAGHINANIASLIKTIS